MLHTHTRRPTHTHTHMCIYTYIHTYTKGSMINQEGCLATIAQLDIFHCQVIFFVRGSVSHDEKSGHPQQKMPIWPRPIHHCKKKTKTPKNNINNTLHVPLCSFILTYFNQYLPRLRLPWTWSSPQSS